MRALDRKLVRDLRRLWAQVLAIALVMAAGAATLILGIGAHDSLFQTRERYYIDNRFADIFATVTRAPLHIARDIAAIDGVRTVETRIVKLALADVRGMAEPGSVQIVSLPETGEQKLNALSLVNGRLPSSGTSLEAVANADFAKAHKLVPGDNITVLLNGRKTVIRVTGTALSPEFIYVLGPGDLMPDPRRFGVLWMRMDSVAAAYGLEGAFSEISLKLDAGMPQEPVISEIDKRLRRFGGTGAHGRKDQVSHAFLDAELEQLRAMSRVLPPIFLVVSAFLVNMTLLRMITLEREQIGLLKATGYSSRSIAWHYIKFALVVAAAGVIIGAIAGTWLGHGMAQLYARFFSFPYLVFSRDPSIYAIAAIITLAAAAIGALRAVSSVVFLPPAVAMSPPAPARYRQWLPVHWRMPRIMDTRAILVSRHLLHWPWRLASGVAGMALACAILVGSLWSMGSLEKVIDITFYKSDRQDASIQFTTKRPISALHDLRGFPGILRAEPYRAVPVRLRNGTAERRVALMGRPADADLSRLLDTGLNKVALPTHGLVLSDALASILGVRVGESVQVEFIEDSRKVELVPVSGIVNGYLGLSAMMDLTALNRLAREQAVISGVNLKIDPTRTEALFDRLKQTPVANFIVLQKTALKRFRETLAQNITIMVTVYAGLAAIVAFGVVYNFARISLSEQARELASLRVLGFSRGEVSGVLLTELAVVVALAQPLGWLTGYGFAWLMVQGFSSDLYRVPLVVERGVYAYSSLIVIAAAVVSAFIVRRRIDTFDLIAVLKTRD
jgi:putative ABC transport system permease protein